MRLERRLLLYTCARMPTSLFTVALAVLLVAGDPCSLLGPGVKLTPADRRNLDRGETVARTIPSGDGQVAIFAVSPIGAEAETLIARARTIEDLKRSSFVTGIKRFSDPPRLEDLDALVLSPRDVQAAAACKPGDCSFKLTATEIAILRAASAPGPDRDDRIQHAFRQVVFSRVETYLAGGLRQVAPIVNRGDPWCLDRAFNDLLTSSALTATAPCAAEWLRAASASVESFLYWSQESYGAGKPVVVVTHVALIPPIAPADPAIVIGKQIMATRYMTGGLALTAISTDPGSGRRYLVYVNRTGVDLLGGFFGPIKRSILESRLKGDVPEIIAKLRTRLERRDAPAR